MKVHYNKTKRNKRRLYISILIIFLSWLYFGNYTLQTTKLTISDKKLPDSFNGFKIAHLSDVHNKDWGDTLIEPIEVYNPDIIVITGDLIDSSTDDMNRTSSLIQKLTRIAEVYFVSGNHEASSDLYNELEALLVDEGAIVLKNKSIKYKRNNQEIRIVGIEDPSFISRSSMLKEQEAVIENHLYELMFENNQYTLLLSHRPELFELYVQNDVNLVLSGHAHGGQFRFPFIGGLIAPNQGLFPAYTSGIYEEGKTRMIVSRGLGNSIIPIRVNNRPEIIFIELIK